MNLSRTNLKEIGSGIVEIPGEGIFELPERVLQFGTGVLLRGLPDYFIDKANKKGVFNGRVVVVKSTAGGGTETFDSQDGLFTHCVRGIEEGTQVDEWIVNASVSRVISAVSDWNRVLDCAANPDMQVVISNTTEVGITLVRDNIQADPPVSFPGKLLSFLYRRYRHFNGDLARGMVIIPTELIPDNGRKLESIILELAHQNGLESAFLDWLENANTFCNSLVDRIVPGKLPGSDHQEAVKRLGYEDELMIMSEAYRLWAIEATDERIANTLSFSRVDDGVVIVPDINVYRELKLRLLNGSHTFTCGLAYLAGFDTVRQAMDNDHFEQFITDLMIHEIVPCLVGPGLSQDNAIAFARRVLDRYRNPYIHHQWLSITFQYTGKMAMRNIPLVTRYMEIKKEVPPRMVAGFAAYLLFMNCMQGDDGKYYGKRNGERYLVQDDQASYYAENWNSLSFEQLVTRVLNMREWWGVDLNDWPGFAKAVQERLGQFVHHGVTSVLGKLIAEKAGI